MRRVNPCCPGEINSYRKKMCIVILIILLLSAAMTLIRSAEHASAEDDIEDKLNGTIDSQLDSLDLTDIEKLIEGLESYGIFESTFKAKVESVIAGDFAVDGTSFIGYILKLIFSDFLAFLPMYSAIAAIAILSGIVSGLRSGSFSTTTSDVVFYACYSAIILITVSGVSSMYERTYEAISSVRKITEFIMPVLLTLMTAIGGNVTLKVYRPAAAMFAGGVTEIIITAVLPLFLISFVLAVVSNLSRSVRLNKLSSFFGSLSVWVIGLVFTFFTSFLTVQGLTAATIDGISYRAAKFAAKSYIPILGGYISDGFDLILAGSMLIKNAVGVGGLCVMLISVISPIIEVVVFSLGIKLVGALAEPVSDSRISTFLTGTAKSMTILYVSMIAAAFMFFITVTLIIMTSGITLG